MVRSRGGVGYRSYRPLTAISQLNQRLLKDALSIVMALFAVGHPE